MAALLPRSAPGGGSPIAGRRRIPRDRPEAPRGGSGRRPMHDCFRRSARLGTLGSQAGITDMDQPWQWPAGSQVPLDDRVKIEAQHKAGHAQKSAPPPPSVEQELQQLRRRVRDLETMVGTPQSIENALIPDAIAEAFGMTAKTNIDCMLRSRTASLRSNSAMRCSGGARGGPRIAMRSTRLCAIGARRGSRSTRRHQMSDLATAARGA